MINCIVCQIYLFKTVIISSTLSSSYSYNFSFFLQEISTKGDNVILFSCTYNYVNSNPSKNYTIFICKQFPIKQWLWRVKLLNIPHSFWAFIELDSMVIHGLVLPNTKDKHTIRQHM